MPFTENKLSRASLASLRPRAPISFSVPAESLFGLPERVLQFGTGVLLRGLPDFFVDQANRQGVFNGRVVLVKSTDVGSADAFGEQGGLYTLCQRGLDQGEPAEEFVVCSAISRVLSAKGQWPEVLRCAHNPDLQVVISNTTEVGIQLTKDRLSRTSPETPPDSFPGKLTALLYERFRAFGGSAASGLVVIPCELVVDNGTKLKEIVRELARQNGLESAFLDWLNEHNFFCNSLVDRIVTGMPEPAAANEMYERLGYRDDLLTVSETYRLWAIEGDERIREVLSFAQTDEGVIVVPDIQPYRERKLRLLNGTHTLMVGLGFLGGFDTVGACMEDASMSRFVAALLEEIIPSVPVERGIAERFAREVKDRFSNPYIVHPLLNITVQYTSKMRMRNVQTLLNHYQAFNAVPPHLTLGFAAYLLFMKATREENGKYFGERNGEPYPIQDDSAAYFYSKWRSSGQSTRSFVADITADQTQWGTDLNALPGFSEAVANQLDEMMKNGVKNAFERFLESKMGT